VLLKKAVKILHTKCSSEHAVVGAIMSALVWWVWRKKRPSPLLQTRARSRTKSNSP
jgi:hypothetical protein